MEMLHGRGFWVHLFQGNAYGQPADIIAVKNGKAYLIDAKDCKTNNFVLSRIEVNQELAMCAFQKKSRTDSYFALQTSYGVYMVKLSQLLEARKAKSKLSYKEITELAITFEEWCTNADC